MLRESYTNTALKHDGQLDHNLKRLYAKTRAHNGEPYVQQIHLAWIQARNQKISDFFSLQQSGAGSKW